MKKIYKGLMVVGTLSVASVLHGSIILMDFGSASTYNGVTAPSPDNNGNHWNSTGYGFMGNLVDSTGAATTVDWAPDSLGGVDSWQGLVFPIGPGGSPTSAQIEAAQALLDGGSVGVFGVAEAAMDYYRSDNNTTNVGRFQLQQVTEGELYDFAFYGSHQYIGTATTYSVFDDSNYSNLLGSVTISHGSGTGNGNTSNIGIISNIAGPANDNNIFYVQWEGATVSTEGYINAMSLTVVPEPSTYALFLGLVAGLVLLRRRLHRD